MKFWWKKRYAVIGNNSIGNLMCILLSTVMIVRYTQWNPSTYRPQKSKNAEKPIMILCKFSKKKLAQTAIGGKLRSSLVLHASQSPSSILCFHSLHALGWIYYSYFGGILPWSIPEMVHINLWYWIHFHYNNV